jgi:aspartyl-tRNA(Asn)/glutamyl-tRNA(Gln) amidotransferase subunit C
VPHLDDRDLDALAQLARLDLADADREALRGDLERILTYVDRLADVDDPSVAPLRHPALGATAIDAVDAAALRADVPVAGLPVAALAALAPEWRDGWVVVPRTVDAEG